MGKKLREISNKKEKYYEQDYEMATLIAACLVIAVADVVSVPKLTGDNSSVYIANRPAVSGKSAENSGNMLSPNFAKGNIPLQDTQIANGLIMIGSELTAEENKTISGTLTDTCNINAYGIFYNYNHELSLIEGRAISSSGFQGKIVLLSKPQTPLTLLSRERTA